MVVHPLEARLVGLVVGDGEADSGMNRLGRITGLNGDDLEGFAKGTAAIGIDLPDTKSDQGAKGRVESRVCERGRDGVSVGERKHGLDVLSGMKKPPQRKATGVG